MLRSTDNSVVARPLRATAIGGAKGSSRFGVSGAHAKWCSATALVVDGKAVLHRGAAELMHRHAPRTVASTGS